MKNNPIEIQFASFSLGESLFAVDIMRIREIIEPQNGTPLPWKSRFLEEMINLRGVVVPVMNMRKRFGMPPSADGTDEKLLLVTLPNGLMALRVDEVHEIVSVPSDGIKPPPGNGEEPGSECLLGVFLSNGKLYMILDIDNLLSHVEFHILHDAGNNPGDDFLCGGV